ncbi:16S rRNA (adenine(1518)-N(6)/adenine(1519)-N(6))-dimethyltransferase RsmA [Candidatus Hepatincolaceae symbiont of Richtersius coronifer]
MVYNSKIPLAFKSLKSATPNSDSVSYNQDLLAKKALGQHFLIDSFIINQIILAAGDLSNKNVIEIGPGKGILTKELVLKAKTVFAIEKDERFASLLQDLKDQHNNFDFILTDALKINCLETATHPSVLISNLPYNVGTQIFLNCLMASHNSPNKFDCFVLMFQKEVAKRIVAKENDDHYGRLSIFSQLLADVELIFEVAETCFNPPPKVKSAVILVKPLAEMRFAVNIKNLERLTQLAFSGRRKTIRNSLKSLNLDFAALKIDSNKRAEELSLLECCNMANQLI